MIFRRATSAGPTLAGSRSFFLTEAVHAVADDDLLLLGLDMDVARAHEIRVLDDAVRQLDDRAGLLVDEIVLDDLVAAAELGADLLHDVVEAAVMLLAALAELLADVALAAEQADDPHARHLVDLGGQGHLEGVGKRHEQELAHLTHRQHQVFLAELLRDPLKGGRACR
jgi:hypothetical protein